MAVQLNVKGTEPTSKPDVNEAAQEFVDASDKLASARTFMKRCRSELVAKMQKHGMKAYRDRSHGLDVTCETDTTLTVKPIKEKKTHTVFRGKKGKR